VLTVLTQRVHTQRLVNLIHLLGKKNLVVSCDFFLGLRGLHLPDFQDRVLTASGQELSVRAKFGDPDAVRVCLEALYEVPLEILSALFVKFGRV